MSSATSRNPWSYVPLLYFLQAIPVALVQEVATIVYKDLGIANEPITRWTAIVALPWSLQMLFGPLVELTATRRRWVVNSQLVISAVLVGLPFLLRLPNAFELSLGAFLIAALASTICNAAMDGFYLLSLPKNEQAKFAGVQGTFYRLGTLFSKGLLVFLAGKLMAFGTAEIRATDGKPAWTVSAAEAPVLTVKGGTLVDQKGAEVVTGLRFSPDAQRIDFAADGSIQVNGTSVGRLPATSEIQPVSIEAARSPRDAWSFVLLVGGILFTGLYALERFTAPHPPQDIEVEGESKALWGNVARTVGVVGLGLSGYFAANALVRLAANTLWKVRDGLPDGPLKGWRLPDDPTFLGSPLPFGGVAAELAQLMICLALALAFVLYLQKSIRGTAMGETYGSFFRQPKVVAILAFLMFYRFGEAMIMKMSPLFLKDAPTAGGLGLGTDQVGTIKGVVGVFGIVLGGILGGVIVSRMGLRRTIWPLAILMHLPGVLYLWASYARPEIAVMYGVDFVEQFGYGFGYAGYTIVLQRIAQRGNFRTAHYALGVGVGALFIQLAGVLSGVLQTNFGYHGLFWAALFLAIPGLLTLRFIPLDDDEEAAPA